MSFADNEADTRTVYPWTGYTSHVLTDAPHLSSHASYTRETFGGEVSLPYSVVLCGCLPVNLAAQQSQLQSDEIQTLSLSNSSFPLLFLSFLILFFLSTPEVSNGPENVGNALTQAISLFLGYLYKI